MGGLWVLLLLCMYESLKQCNCNKECFWLCFVTVTLTLRVHRGGLIDRGVLIAIRTFSTKLSAHVNFDSCMHAGLGVGGSTYNELKPQSEAVKH